MIITEMRNIRLARLNLRNEFTEKEIQVGDSSELFQRVEDEEGDDIVLAGLDLVVTELRLGGPAPANIHHPHWSVPTSLQGLPCFGHFPELTLSE